MPSIPMYNTIGQQSAQLADKLFSTINRRHELKTQGKLAELQANLSREERVFGAESQRLRDRDYQKFQERMREDQQLHQRTERISRQTFQSVESGKQRAKYNFNPDVRMKYHMDERRILNVSNIPV